VDGQVEFSQDVVSKIIESYTRESGVRNLEREIGSVCRAKAVEYAEAKDSGHTENYRPQLSVDDIEEILGIEKFDEEIAEKTRYVHPHCLFFGFTSGMSIRYSEDVNSQNCGRRDC